MPSDRLQHRADQLAARVEALAAALRAAGVPEETSSRLLSHASAAVLDVLTLELLVQQHGLPDLADTSTTVERRPSLELDVRLAA